jgi:hypothetical protein
VERRRRKPLAKRALVAQVQHVRGDVDAVDVVAGVQPWDEQPARSTGGVERRLSLGDEPPEVLQLVTTVEVELRPPTGDDAVVPCLRAQSAIIADQR